MNEAMICNSAQYSMQFAILTPSPFHVSTPTDQGARTFDDLKKFAEENLKPMCSPKNIDLCDDEKKADIKVCACCLVFGYW